MITKSIYSYRVRIKYGVYTRTIIGGIFLPLSLPTHSLLFALCPPYQVNRKRSCSRGGGDKLGPSNTLYGGFPLVQANAEAEAITQNRF